VIYFELDDHAQLSRYCRNSQYRVREHGNTEANTPVRPFERSDLRAHLSFRLLPTLDSLLNNAAIPRAAGDAALPLFRIGVIPQCLANLPAAPVYR
jgi:hypothetical protein